VVSGWAGASSAQAQSRTGGTVVSTTPIPVEPVSSATRIAAKPVLPPAMCPPPDGTRPDSTLVNVDPFVLRRFPLQRVYQQLVSLSGSGTPSAVGLYQQMWDSLDKSSAAKFSAPHCDDPGAINQFPIDCPRQEKVLKDSAPESFTPVGLFNRFDLSSSDGTICGEYRIVYALGGRIDNPYPGDPKLPPEASALSAKSATTQPVIDKELSLGRGRNFIIFEGVLPNPNPRCGIEACRPVVKFWESLATLDATTAAGQTALADRLERFYFKGLPGFEPVVHPGHYGASGGGGYGQKSGGQIRTNMFLDAEWQLREFHLIDSCNFKPGCKLVLDPVTVKTNPYHEMFDVLNPTPDPRAGAFQSLFPGQAGPLSTDVVAQISMSIDDKFNAGQSTSQDFTENYELQFGLGSPHIAFSNAITSVLTSLPTPRFDLTPEDIVRRAETQSCGGCHEQSNGVALGGKLNPTWPPSRGFVHIDEASFLSEALWCVFLPARKTVLDGFAASPGIACPPVATSPTPITPVVVLSESSLDATLPNIEPSALTVAGKVSGPN
jgi:hypothetical protein